MSEATRYLANPVVSCREEDADGALLFNPDADDTAIVDATGQVIWELLRTPHTLAQIVAHLTEMFRVPDPAQAASDVERFVQALLPDFIVTVDDDPEHPCSLE
jgi:hypothetical protein